MSKRKRSIRDFFEFEGDFYTYTGKIFDMVLVSIYWFLGCIPIVTIGASFAALHRSVTKSIRQDRETITKQFWKSYKQNLIPSLGLTTAYGMVLFLLLLNIGILRAKMQGLVGLFFMTLYVIVGIFVIVCACYGFPALSRFDMPVGWIIKLSGYMTVRHLPISLLLLAMTAAAYLAIFVKPLLVMIIPGVFATVASPIIEPLLERHMPTGTTETKEEEHEHQTD